MSKGSFGFSDFLLLETIPVLVKETGLDVYDFRFRDFFECKSIVDQHDAPVLLRAGPVENYLETASIVESLGMKLLVTERESKRASLLENWYPLLTAHTPMSRIYDQLPTVDELLHEFSFPVFIKGNRQTNHHKRSLSIIENAEMYESLSIQWEHDKYLHWQKAVVREYVPLRDVDDNSNPDLLPYSYEFRVFFWKQKLVGYGRYWYMCKDYRLHEDDIKPALDLATVAADIINVPFLAVDIAKTKQGEWIVIEVNDGQESGYAGVNRLSLWNNVLRVERREEPIILLA